MPQIQSGQFTTSYDTAGTGAPVILLHCSSSARGQWRELGETLAADFHVMAPDLLGYGDSDKWRGDAGDLIRAEAAAVRALLATADAPLHLVGHSYGAATALSFASQYPGVLKTLTLIEPVSGWLLTGNANRDAYVELKSVADGFRSAFRTGNTETGVRQYVDYWSGPGTWDAMAGGLRTYVLATAEKTACEFAALFDPVNAAAPLDRIQAPVLLLHGAKTREPTLRILKILEAGLNNTRMAAIPGAGHMSPITHRDLVNAEIVRHIKAHAD